MRGWHSSFRQAVQVKLSNVFTKFNFGKINLVNEKKKHLAQLTFNS